jgi:type 2 lantibiotic biosynthesis protein LanM
MEAFFERLIIRAATIDELLSSEFESLPGQKGDADKAARRLAAWCRSCASGDWALFGKRLERDGLSVTEVLQRLATVRPRFAVQPTWIDDAIWIESAMRSCDKVAPVDPKQLTPCAFESLLAPVVEQADALLWSSVNSPLAFTLSGSARQHLRHNLLAALSDLCAPALYERFTKKRKEAAFFDPMAEQQQNGTAVFDRFIADLRNGGLRLLFEEKPVLLRLISVIVRQWIDTTRELLLRLGADLRDLRGDILSSEDSPISFIEGDLSDSHNCGRSVRIIGFADGARIVYKPKDLRLDAAWRSLVTRLNEADAPVKLKAAHVVVRQGYGWAEFIDHLGCADASGVQQFFFRAGALLAVFHLFAGTDMHQENIIAAGDYPVPIDLEMILQPSADENKSQDAEAEAFETATETIMNSVMAVSLLPSYEKVLGDEVFSIGGLRSGARARFGVAWSAINSDAMRPRKVKKDSQIAPNLPHVGGRTARFSDHIDDFVSGFEVYAQFLMRLKNHAGHEWLFDQFAGLPVRRILRHTRFYYMLLGRLKNYKGMDDGAAWSAQADFLARLANWERNSDTLWPLQRSERLALLQLNLPHFMSASDGEISDATGTSVCTGATPGLIRARTRVKSFDEEEIAWQVSVIRQNTSTLTRSTPMARKRRLPNASRLPTREIFIAEAARIADEIACCTVRRGPGAAWIGLDWMGDSEIAQLLPLGPDLYNGTCGLAVFLAAHATVSGSDTSRQLALAAVAQLRKNIRSRNAARIARSLGIGGACGLGSIVYALAVIAKCLCDDALLADAHRTATLFTDDLIAADKMLDVLNGSAGAILAVLRLHRDTRSTEVLNLAIKCGEHLLAQRRSRANGYCSWIAQGAGDRPLNGIAHGAAGFAYALACLSAAAGRKDFADASVECIAFEDSTYDAAHSNWRDLRGNREPSFSCQWCHGAPGIGLARIGMKRLTTWDRNSRLHDGEILERDLRNALVGTECGWPHYLDTMCCGTLGSIELFREAADALGRPDLRDKAARRMLAVIESATRSGGYRFAAGSRQFNLGLFQGVAGVGYACLRQCDASLPNILIWE